MIDKSSDLIEEEKEEENNNDENNINKVLTKNLLKINNGNENEKGNIVFLKKTLSLKQELSTNININTNIENNYDDKLIEENQEENNMSVDEEHGSFSNINMIPRTIEDLVRKEKKKFSYLNRNLIIILIILFFCNLLKENFIAYSSYYI